RHDACGYLRVHILGHDRSCWTAELHTSRLSLPLLAKGAYFQLERPGTARLLIKLPVGFRDRQRRHQQIRVVERVRSQRLDPTLTHPFGVDAGIDDEVG